MAPPAGFNLQGASACWADPAGARFQHTRAHERTSTVDAPAMSVEHAPHARERTHQERQTHRSGRREQRRARLQNRDGIEGRSAGQTGAMGGVGVPRTLSYTYVSADRRRIFTVRAHGVAKSSAFEIDLGGCRHRTPGAPKTDSCEPNLLAAPTFEKRALPDPSLASAKSGGQKIRFSKAEKSIRLPHKLPIWDFVECPHGCVAEDAPRSRKSLEYRIFCP